jgi:hypothetical protein
MVSKRGPADTQRVQIATPLSAAEDSFASRQRSGASSKGEHGRRNPFEHPKRSSRL